MESQNQYYYGRNQGPSMQPPQPQQQQQQQQNPSAFPSNSMDHSKMGPMMRALTEDFDMSGQNSTPPSYPEQGGLPSMPGVNPGAGDQQRVPSNNFGPASQTLSGYASQYSTGQGSHNYFAQGHQPSPLNSGFSSPGGNYPAGGMTGPYQRQIPASSPLGSPNGHGHSYPRSASAGPTIPSPIMMHGSGMYPHNQTSPGNRSTPFGFPTSPTSPHNHLNHASPPLVSPSSMRPGGNLHSPKSLPASSPVPFVSQMSPTASRAQSVPTLPGNTVDHVPPMSHMRSKSPGSAGIHRPFPQPPPSQPQPLFPLPSPKVRPVDQTDSRGQYVELVHSKPKEQWNSFEKPGREITRNNSEKVKASDPGHLPRLEEMVAVLGDSSIKETLDEIVSDKNLGLGENGDDACFKGKENNVKITENDKKATNNNAHVNEKRTHGDDKNVNTTEDTRGLANGFVGSGDLVDGKGISVNGSSSDKNPQTVPQSRNGTKPPNVKTNNSNGRTDAEKESTCSNDSSNSTNPVKNGNNTPIKQPNPNQTRPQSSNQTKEVKVERQEDHKPPTVSESSKCQNENTPSKHSPDQELAANVPSTSTPNVTVESDVQTPAFNNPMTTPTAKRKSPEDSGSSTGNESLPLKKRRGRPPGSKTKNRKEGEEGKPRKKSSKKKKLDLECETDQSKEKPVKSVGKTMVKPKQETNTPTVRGPILRVQGSSIDSVVSSQFINSPDAEKEEIVKGGKKLQKKTSKHIKRHGGVVSAPVGQAAIVASECVNPTGLWICALCGNPPNFEVLGDLYGPYNPPGSDASSLRRDSSSKRDRHRGSSSWDSHHSSRGSRHLPSTSRSNRGQRVDPRSQSQRGKALMAKQAETAKSRKWRQVQTYMDEMSLTLGRKSIRRRKSEMDDGVSELWVHEECAVWSQGVIFLQGALYGIHEAIKEAECKKCNLCHDTGASIGCLSKGCKHVYHYLCAIEAECHMHLENYSMTCPKHKDKKIKMRGGP